MSGTITHLHIKPAHEKPMRAEAEVTVVSRKGFTGDVSFGRSKRQVLMIEAETLQHFGLQPGQVRENVTVSGIQLAGLPAGTLVRAGEATLQVTGDCAPCEQMEAIRPGLQEDIRGKRGTLFRVVEGGPLRVGDTIAVLVAEPA